MEKKNTGSQWPENAYDDGNIQQINLPDDTESAEPLPESTRPRKDGPGGE